MLAAMLKQCYIPTAAEYMWDAQQHMGLQQVLLDWQAEHH